MDNIDSINLNGFLLMLWGFSYLFFIPGWLVIETFFGKLKAILKFPLYFLLSIVISSYNVYFFSLALGFNRLSIILSAIPFFVWAAWRFYSFIKKHEPLIENVSELKSHFVGILSGVAIGLMFFLALYPAIFTFSPNGVVLAQPNWQDTAMHISIITSLEQGNFPPQMPYFSGAPLNYYYFADFHASILPVLYGDFFPRTLVYTNPFFAMILGWSVYALGYIFSKRKAVALISGILAIFYGNFMFMRFLSDLWAGDKTDGFFHMLTNLLRDKVYTIDYLGIMTISPMADYYLQNRPAMIGLIIFTVCLAVICEAYRQNDGKLFLLAGLITGAALKFHYFAFLSSGIAMTVCAIWYMGRVGIKKNILSLLYYGIPVAVLFFVNFMTFSINNTGFTKLLNGYLKFQLWHEQTAVLWHIKMFLSNFGIQFVLVAVLIILLLLRKVDWEHFLLLNMALILFIIPYVISFTVQRYDMIKFFYFAVIPVSVLCAVVIAEIIKIKYIGKILASLIIIAASFTSLINLGGSYFNEQTGYTLAEYDAGIWLRDNSPRASVFITSPTVHSAVTDIGGRLRVLSYITWPYSHGLHSGEDNVFSRLNDIKNIMNPLIAEDFRMGLLNKYKTDYIYYGNTEKNQFPGAISFLENSSKLTKVYDVENIKIYRIIK
jgi:hypothetical protein